MSKKKKKTSRQKGSNAQLEAAEYFHHYCRFSLASVQRLWLCLVPGARGATGL